MMVHGHNLESFYVYKSISPMYWKCTECGVVVFEGKISGKWLISIGNNREISGKTMLSSVTCEDLIIKEIIE